MYSWTVFYFALVLCTTWQVSGVMYYRDALNVLYGPFDENQLKEWWRAGYFHDNVPATRDIQTGFRPMKEYFEEGSGSGDIMKHGNSADSSFRSAVAMVKKYGLSIPVLLRQSGSALKHNDKGQSTARLIDNSTPSSGRSEPSYRDTGGIEEARTTAEFFPCPGLEEDVSGPPPSCDSEDDMAAAHDHRNWTSQQREEEVCAADPTPQSRDESVALHPEDTSAHGNFNGEAVHSNDTEDAMTSSGGNESGKFIAVNSIGSGGTMDSWQDMHASRGNKLNGNPYYVLRGVRHTNHKYKNGLKKLIFSPFRRPFLFGSVSTRRRSYVDSSSFPQQQPSSSPAEGMVAAGMGQSLGLFLSSPQAAALLSAYIVALISRIGIGYRILTQVLLMLAEATPIESIGAATGAGIGKSLLAELVAYWKSWAEGIAGLARAGHFLPELLVAASAQLSKLRSAAGWLHFLSTVRSHWTSFSVLWSTVLRGLVAQPHMALLSLLVTLWTAVHFVVLPVLAKSIEDHRLRLALWKHKYNKEFAGATYLSDDVAKNAADTHFLLVFWQSVSTVFSAALGMYILAAMCGPSWPASFAFAMMILEGWRTSADESTLRGFPDHLFDELKTLDQVDADLAGRDWENLPGGPSLKQTLLYRRSELHKSIEQLISCKSSSMHAASSREFWLQLRAWVGTLVLLLLSASDMGLWSLHAFENRGPILVMPPGGQSEAVRWKSAVFARCARAFLDFLPLWWRLTFCNNLNVLRSTWLRKVSASTLSTLQDTANRKSIVLTAGEDCGWSEDGPDPMGGIVLDGITFAGSGQIIARNISIHFPAGAISALVGDAASGKQYVRNLIQPTEESAVAIQKGRAFIRGRLITEWNARFLRSRIATLNRREEVFNIWAGALAGFYDAGSQEDIALQWKACEVSGAKELMELFPNGSSEFVSPHIIARLGLTDDMLRKFALCRLLINLRDKYVIILDEPTLYMSEAEESAFFDYLRSHITPDQVVVVLSARLSTAQKCDNVINMPQGIASLAQNTEKGEQ